MTRRLSLVMNLLCARIPTLLTGLFLCLQPALAQDTHEGASDNRSVEEKIQNALSAAPEHIAGAAAVWDWPSEVGGEIPVLREGTNGWTCFPSRAHTPGNDPMCHDEAFLKWAMAFMHEAEPDLERVGLSYMLQGGGEVDEAGQQTVGPHVMIALPDVVHADGIQRAEHADGPFVAYGDTPYELVIMPVAAAGDTLQLANGE